MKPLISYGSFLFKCQRLLQDVSSRMHLENIYLFLMLKSTQICLLYFSGNRFVKRMVRCIFIHLFTHIFPLYGYTLSLIDVSMITTGYQCLIKFLLFYSLQNNDETIQCLSDIIQLIIVDHDSGAQIIDAPIPQTCCFTIHSSHLIHEVGKQSTILAKMYRFVVCFLFTSSFSTTL